MVLMKTRFQPQPPRPGRPKSSPLTRLEQVRVAKRAQRARERTAGVTIVPVKLAAKAGEQLRVLMRQPHFELWLAGLLDEAVIEVAAYENLALLFWNRPTRPRYLSAEDAFKLYERNWRHVDLQRLKAAERDLIQRLALRYGNGVLNV